MKARTELLLLRLSWFLDPALHPTWGNIHASFESLAFGNIFRRQIRNLEARALIESQTNSLTGRRVTRLTAHALDLIGTQRNPHSRWSRPWDGNWRLAIFDLPETDRLLRATFRRWLAAHGFGCIQRSVWISPDPLTNMHQRLSSLSSDAKGLLLLESTSEGIHESAASLVRAAWNFTAINRAWQHLADHLQSAPTSPPALPPETARRWANHELKLATRALAIDPLLPSQLLPPDYLGRSTWDLRKRVFASLDQAVSPRPS